MYDACNFLWYSTVHVSVIFVKNLCHVLDQLCGRVARIGAMSAAGEPVGKDAKRAKRSTKSSGKGKGRAEKRPKVPAPVGASSEVEGEVSCDPISSELLPSHPIPHQPTHPPTICFSRHRSLVWWRVSLPGRLTSAYSAMPTTPISTPWTDSKPDWLGCRPT